VQTQSPRELVLLHFPKAKNEVKKMATKKEVKEVMKKIRKLADKPAHSPEDFIVTMEKIGKLIYDSGMKKEELEKCNEELGEIEGRRKLVLIRKNNLMEKKDIDGLIKKNVGDKFWSGIYSPLKMAAKNPGDKVNVLTIKNSPVDKNRKLLKKYGLAVVVVNTDDTLDNKAQYPTPHTDKSTSKKNIPPYFG
jgi:hypothetical protein